MCSNEPGTKRPARMPSDGTDAVAYPRAPLDASVPKTNTSSVAPFPSGTFLAVPGAGIVLAGQQGCLGFWGVVPISAFGGVGVEVEQVVEALLGGVDLGEHASGAGSSAFALVEQHGFLDPAEGVE